jgi:excisionase family DNA binding protein
MSHPHKDSNPVRTAESQVEQQSSRIPVLEIARRLNIGRLAAYSLLEQGIIPGIRLGRRWIITRHAYEQWERTCGTQVGPTGLCAQPEVTVVN